MKREYIFIGKQQFLKGCAEKLTISKFKTQFAHVEAYGVDLEKAFVILGGVIESKKVFKKSESKD